MWFAATSTPGAAIGQSGKVYQIRALSESTPQVNELAQPTGFNVTDTKPTSANYRNRLYLAGLGSDNAMVDEFYRFGRQGRPAPTEIPTLAAAAGPGTTGSAIVCIAFGDSKSGDWGPLSGPSAAVALANQARTTGNLPTTCSDPRMDLIGVWVSMDGSAFRLATKRTLGVASITENVATLALGEAFPTTFTALPRGTMNAIYHERQFIAGDSRFPDVLYCSGILFPERYESLSFTTRNGEPITFIIATRELLLVFTSTAAYALRGYTEDDMSLDLIDGDIGAFGPLCGKLVNGNPVFANDKGIWLYNGAFHLILKDRQAEWAAAVKAEQGAYEAGFAVVDPNSYTFEFYVNPVTATPLNYTSYGLAFSPQTLSWVGYYKDAVPEISGSYGQYEWSFDTQQRKVTCAAFLSVPGGKRGDLYQGASDAKIRYRDATDDNDDSDSLVKTLFIRHGALDMGDPGGMDEDGKTFVEMWSYLKSETSAWKFYLKSGDDYAERQMVPDNLLSFWTQSIAASFKTETRDINGTTYSIDSIPKSRHPHLPQRVSGHCLVPEYWCSSPIGFVFGGFGGTYGPGPGTRPPADVSEPE